MNIINNILKIGFFLSILFVNTIKAEITKPLELLKGPEDGVMYSFDYNAKAGISAAIVVSEFIINNNTKEPKRFFLMIKKDGESNWKTIFTNIRTDAKVKVWDNSVISCKSEFLQWNSDKGKFLVNNWVAYTLDLGANWSTSSNTWQSQTFGTQDKMVLYSYLDYIYVSFDFGKKTYKNPLPNKNRGNQNYIYYSFYAISDSGMSYMQSWPSYYNYQYKDTMYLIKSKDFVKWQGINIYLRENLKDMIFRDERRIFALSDSTGILYSNDSCNSFKRININGMKFTYFKFTDKNRNKIFVANESSAFLINCDDYSYSEVKLPSSSIRGIACNEGVLYFGDFNYGILKSTDNGNNWKVIDKPTKPLYYTDINIIDKNIYVTSNGLDDYKDYRIYRSKDDCKSWDLIFTSKKGFYNFKLNNNFYILNNDNNKILKINDPVKEIFDLKNKNFFSLMSFGESKLILKIGINSNYEFYQSDNNGDSWYQIDTIPIKVNGVPYLRAGNGDYYSYYGYYYHYDKNFNEISNYKTDFLKITEQTGNPRDGFKYYTRASEAFLLKDKAGDPVIFEGDDTYYEKKKNIYNSTDNGITWIKNPLQVYGIMRIKNIIQTQNLDIFYCTVNGVMKYNSNKKVLDKINNFPINTFVIDTTLDYDTYFFLKMDYNTNGTVYGILRYYGLFKFESNGTSPEISLKDSITIFPNPIDNEAELHFKVNQDRAIVTIKVYDYIGKQYADLFLDVLNKGDYNQKVNLANVPKGYYYIVIDAGGEITSIPIYVKHD